ncbi:MAG: hypothetical protein Fur005_21220 [Roseiflexaceae bacterium]
MLISLLLFPGIVATLLIAGLLAWAMQELPSRQAGASLLRWPGGLFTSLSMLLMALGAGVAAGLAGWQIGLGWLLIELGALLPLLPNLATRQTLTVRAAVREVQGGVAGRVVIWCALGAALLAGSEPLALPGRLLLLIAVILALPAAASLGPFGPELSLVPDRSDQSLDEGVRALLPYARYTRAAALLGVVAVVMTPATPLGMIGPLVGALLLALVLLAILRWSRVLPRMTLPMQLRWCWWRAMPLALAGLVYLLVFG